MTELLTADQMRALEQAAIAGGRVTGLDLMERAGVGVVEAVLAEWPALAEGTHRAVVLCGPGNNGGDGLVVARLLKARGWEVEAFLYGDPDRMPPDAKANCERWSRLGGIRALTLRAIKDTPAPDLWIDAIFGIGLSRPVTGALSDVLRYLAGSGGDSAYLQPKLVAVDIPSGLGADTGTVPGKAAEEWAPACLFCALTVTFHRAKPGHVLGDGPSHCGRLVVADIGLDPFIFPKTRPPEASFRTTRLLTRADVANLAKPPGHKYSHGHALVLSGGAGRTGAARLAARGALRVGAGLVTLGVPPAAQMECAAQVTAIMLARVEDGDRLAAVLEDGRLTALCLGPGMGTERARELVPVAVRAEHAPYVVFDADALTAFADDPKAFFAMLHENCVLTPHGGEFARLFPDIAEKLNAPAEAGPACSKVDATREAAARAGCVVLFKGPDTVIAAPDGRCSVNAAVYDRAAPWLATAGSGDVLAGMICGLMARGLPALQAAETAAWLHVEAARRFGPGLIAEDLPEALPGVLRDLGL